MRRNRWIVKRAWEEATARGQEVWGEGAKERCLLRPFFHRIMQPPSEHTHTVEHLVEFTVGRPIVAALRRDCMNIGTVVLTTKLRK
jgi:hypothetical protein